MLVRVTKSNFEDFRKGCGYEHVFGSRALTAFIAYGEDHPVHRFWLSIGEENVDAVLHLNGSVLTVIKNHPSTNEDTIIDDIIEVCDCRDIDEIDSDWDLCEILHERMRGYTESSYYMEYKGGKISGEFADIKPADLMHVFCVLQQSHEYYRTHLKFEPWAEHLENCINAGGTRVYQLERDGQVIGTGSIISQDETHAAIAAVAVIPEYRLQGLGSYITNFLVGEIQKMGKTPCLISGYDEVAELYKKIDFVTVGRWGELYI